MSEQNKRVIRRLYSEVIEELEMKLVADSKRAENQKTNDA